MPKQLGLKASDVARAPAEKHTDEITVMFEEIISKDKLPWDITIVDVENEHQGDTHWGWSTRNYEGRVSKVHQAAAIHPEQIEKIALLAPLTQYERFCL